MATDAANTLLGKVIDVVFVATKREIGYVWNYSDNVNKLRHEAKKLSEMKARVEQRIVEANSKGDRLLAGVEDWIKEAVTEISKTNNFLREEPKPKKDTEISTTVTSLEEDAKAEKDDTEKSTTENLLEEEDKTKTTCFNSCVNFGTLRHYSKVAISKTLALRQIHGDGTAFETCVSIPAPTPTAGDLYERKNLDKIDTQKLTLDKIMKALLDESIQLVGIHGPGGVGKTTLAKEVAADAKNLFQDIVFITVSQTVDAEKIKEKVEVAAKRIMNGDKVLIILDDIWEEIELSDVGIPSLKDHKNCKMLLTSRSRHVCDLMNVQSSIFVTTLPGEEAWILFKRVVGERLETDVTIRKISRDVVEECGGLPLIIQVLGKALRRKPAHLWEAALDQLQKHAPVNIAPEIKKAYTHLKLSYDYLESDEAKSCFLLCSLFPEDYYIKLKKLVRYGVGLQIFKDLDSIDDARNRVEVAVDILKSSFLLFCDEEENTVRMHDVVRDVALLIASEGKGNFFVKDGKGLTEWPPILNNTSSGSSYTKISLVDHYISELPDGQELHLPLVDTFLIQENALSIVPDGFFRGLTQVKVLDLSWNKISSLPPSLKLLTKLRMLDLSRNNGLREISVLGELKELEILKLPHTGIKTIPQEMGQLTKLRLLNVKNCPYLDNITPGVISKLTCLEELSIGFCGDQYIGELCELKSFKNLHLCVSETDIDLLEGTQLEALAAGFCIQIGSPMKNPFTGLLNLKSAKRQLFIADCNITPFLKKLVQVSDAIIFKEIKDMYSILPGVYHESFDGLKSIVLFNCPMVSCLVKASDGDLMQTVGERKPLEKFFSQVEEIYLIKMDGLKLLWDCPDKYISFRNLQIIKFAHCNSLKTLFPATVGQGVVNLGEIHIRDCAQLEVVILASDVNTSSGEIEETDASTETDVNIVFPRLTRITLKYLPKLESFYSGHSTIKYPSLKMIHVSGCRRMTRWGYGVQDIPKISFHHQGTLCSINDIVSDETREDDIKFGNDD